MRIAQIAPLYESVPPRLYGGTERIVSYLTEELALRGHEVTLFASGDSNTSARLVSPCLRSLRLDTNSQLPLLPHYVQMEQVQELADQFDVLHFHTDYMHFPVFRRQSTPWLTTLHGRLDFPETRSLFSVFYDCPLVAISDNQLRPVHRASFVRTIHHGLPPNLYQPHSNCQDYLAFVGRVSADKGLDKAIEIARLSGHRIRVAAKIDTHDQDYFDQNLRPLLCQSHVEYVGEIHESEKNEFIGQAKALLFPIQWPEPFGLVMIEAMACGTPVIATPFGSVPEIIRDGVTGFVVKGVLEAVEAIRRLPEISREVCRQEFENRFTSQIMTDNYLDVYASLIRNPHPSPQWLEPNIVTTSGTWV